MTIRRIVVDALQVGAEPTGVGRQAAAIGGQLGDLPDGLVLELRCARETAPLLAPFFPPGTLVSTPLRRSTPRALRILVQQRARDDAGTLLVSLGDQAPLRTRARLFAVVNDLRRFAPGGDTGALERAWYRFVVPRVARRADVLVTISEASADAIERTLGRRPLVVAHHPVPVVESAPHRSSDAPLLVVGALRAYKGLDTVVGALALLPPEQRPRVVIAGPGDREPVLRHAREAGVADRLDLVGWVDERELEQLYARAGALIAPSRGEGYGLPVAEALARGLPVVASAIPPHVEVGGDAIVTFAPGDAQGLADALRALDLDTLATAALARSHELAAQRPRWRDLILAAAAQ